MVGGAVAAALCAALCVCALADPRLFKDEKVGVFYLRDRGTNTFHPIADEANVRFLGFDPKSYQVMSYPGASLLWPITAAQLPPQNADISVTNMLLKVDALYRQTFWRGLQSLGNLINPSVTRWRDKYVVAYCAGGGVSLAWMGASADGQLRLLAKNQQLGLRDEKGHNPYNSSSSALRDDPRLLTRADGSLSMSFVRLNAAGDRPQMSYLNITVEEGQVRFSSEQILHAKDHHRNWIPFEHHGEQLWIASINPLHIVRHNSTEPGPETKDYQVAVVEDVVKAASEVALPWSDEFGLPLRGGTPAILVRGLYLAFFHTLSNFQKKSFRLQTDFMGAITFCAEPPFSIYSMTPYPIVKAELYQGVWHSNHRDYALFPSGIALSSDQQQVLVSLGHQDRHAFLATFDVEDLLESMEVVHKCPMRTLRDP